MIDEAVLQRVLGVALRTGGDFAEVFAENRRSSSASLEEGKVTELTSGRDRGAGIRVIRGETTGFAHTADLTERGLRDAAEAAAAASRSTAGGVQVAALTRREVPRPHDVEILPEDVPKARKVELLLRADEAARSEGGAIRQAAGGYGGVLFHEACGHGLEADLVNRDASVFRGRMGEQVASPHVNLVDDGTYAREWGTYSVDDEGNEARRNTLIENGVLTDYMWDFLRARKEGRASSGNGRRQSYQHLPMVRMTNTYVLAGTDDPDEIIRQTPHGIYCVQLGGGQVNTATGDFVFGITEAYMIEDGEVTDPVRAANLIGHGYEVLRSIDALGNDFDTWAGTCGKDGQGVPVSSGQPTLRVASITVGGTAG